MQQEGWQLDCWQHKAGAGAAAGWLAAGAGLERSLGHRGGSGGGLGRAAGHSRGLAGSLTVIVMPAEQTDSGGSHGGGDGAGGGVSV